MQVHQNSKLHGRCTTVRRASVLGTILAAVLLGNPAHAGPVQLSCAAGEDGFITVFPDEFGNLVGCSNTTPALFDPLGPNPSPYLGTICTVRFRAFDEARTIRQAFNNVPENFGHPVALSQLIPGSDQILGTTARESAFTLDAFPGVTVHLRQTVTSNVLTQVYTLTNQSAQTYHLRLARIADVDLDPGTWAFNHNYADLRAEGVPRVLDSTKTVSVSLEQSGDITPEGYRIAQTGWRIFYQADQYLGFPATNMNSFFRTIWNSPYLDLGVYEIDFPSGFGMWSGDQAIAVQALMELPPGASRRYITRLIWAPGAEDDCDGVPPSQDACPDTQPGQVVDPEGCTLEQRLDLCEDPSITTNPGGYLSCVAHQTAVCVQHGLITQRERAQIIKSAARSNRGK